jgi:hypothetical protein
VTDEDELLEVAGTLRDDIAVLTARGAPRTTVKLRVDGSALLVDGLEYSRLAEALPKPDLGIDPALRMGRIGTGAVRMRGLLRSVRATLWPGEVIELVHLAKGRSALRFIKNERAIETFDFAPGGRHAVVDEHLYEQVDRGLPQLDERGAELTAEIEHRGGIRSWRMNQDTGTLTLTLGDGTLEFPLLILASYSRESSTLLWSWANPSIDRAWRGPMASVREKMAKLDVSAFTRERTWMEPAFAMVLAQLAAWRAGARGVLPADQGPGVLFLGLP